MLNLASCLGKSGSENFMQSIQTHQFIEISMRTIAINKIYAYVSVSSGYLLFDNMALKNVWLEVKLIYVEKM